MNEPVEFDLASPLFLAARRMGEVLLSSHSERVVLAESCTAGLVAAALASVPGISQHLCGSLVSYREASKAAWLGVEPDLLAKWTAVSRPVTSAMALGALERTVEASWSAAVTGHLGPGAPPELDGLVFIAIARRNNDRTGDLVAQHRHRLATSSRTARQQEAAILVLDALRQELIDKARL